MNDLLNQFLLGAIVACCAVAGLFFFRFYTRTHDRLLAIFATAFWVLGLNWLALAILTIIAPGRDEIRTWLYVVRLLAFSLIIFGIIDKNRASRRQ